MAADTIQRFTRGARIIHWLIAGSGLALFISGITHLPPLHLPAAALFIGSILAHALGNLVRRDYSLLPFGGTTTPAAATNRGKFLTEQRLAHTAIGIGALLLVVSGVLLFVGHAAHLSEDLAALVVAGWLHRLAALGFVAWVALHVGALLLPRTRPLLGAMISGKVARAYAQAHYPEWVASKTSRPGR